MGAQVSSLIDIIIKLSVLLINRLYQKRRSGLPCGCMAGAHAAAGVRARPNSASTAGTPEQERLSDNCAGVRTSFLSPKDVLPTPLDIRS
jgi:hypothetical protein